MDSISRDTFKNLDTDSKLMVLFDQQVTCLEHLYQTKDRLTNLERKVYGISTVMGLAGGLVTLILKPFLWRY